MSAEIVADADPFVHPALFYREEEAYLAGTVPFVRAGLAAGEPVAVAVPGDNLKLLQTELGRSAESVQFLDMTQAGRNPGRIIPGVLRAFADRHANGRVRIIGEPIWAGRTEPEYPACVQHEALINLAFTGRAVTILCPYDAARLDPEVLADAHATHPVVVDGGRERTSDTYSPEHVVATYNQPLPPPAGAAAFTFAADHLAGARYFAVGQAGELGLTGWRLDDLALAVAELTTNSVVHGGGSGTVRVWAEDGQVVCQIEDGGHLSDPLAGRRPPQRDQLGGRGLLLVHQVSDLVRIHTGQGGTTVRFHFGP
ncbi:anti-sigma factor RsbA family regulatory protein [Streptomyces sp. NPDC004647]|uniref:anti-sigma factor RsbA family regulatory protein n=1 Tax=Streptomyces sp. NPDC004647 TaxID=3154671 RepID=UPI0033B09616